MAQTQPDRGRDPRVLSAPAALMAGEEDWAIFRRFDEFNLLNLLILQDEVQKLTTQLKQLYPQTTDHADGDAKAWYMLAHPLARNNAPTTQTQAQESVEAKRREVWKDLKEKLKEYNGALLEMAHLRNLEPPGPDHIKRLRRELDTLASQSLLPEEATVCWEAANDDDFVVLRSGVDNGGRLNTWIRLGIEILKWELWGRHKATTATVSDAPPVIALGKKRPHMSRAEMARKHAFASRFTMALFGGIALILPTVIMSKLQGINVSLITTSIAVFLFGLALAFGATDSTGKDVLTATAAYTAVLVVFVGTSLDTSGGDGSANPSAAANSTV
ncbi:uncharacterized protein B0H64DRAFT_143298 [Chaetomium fimeti]|uniref:DUF6594 domain-containing protein n=1 Tax=Chaetomium fimeti TaxID=1854472 RepID=A0AAE0HGJ5_9PEZI|nr:hypothetical protein B0H64DRAFT_143298 [Chaetomium fimeti]